MIRSARPSVWPRILAAVCVLSTGTTLHALPTIDVVLRTGDPAPGTVGATIASFVEPPSIVESIMPGEAYMALHVTLAGPGVTPATSHAIYRWSSETGDVDLVARGGDVVVFHLPGGIVGWGLTALESPIASASGRVAFTAQTDAPGRGLLVGRPGNVEGWALVGQSVTVPCESVSGAPCGPVAGTLSTMATFGDRKGAAFATYYEPELDFAEDTVVFRGAVQTAAFGVPDALWERSVDPIQLRPLNNLSNSLMKADGIDQSGAATYFDDFTDVAITDREIYGLATVSRNAAYAVYRYFVTVDNQLLARYHAPDMVPRRDLHVASGRISYAGGVTDMPFDGDTSTRGVWMLGTGGGPQVQLYQANTTPAPGYTTETIGPPLGQALVTHARLGVPGSVFAANLSFGLYAGTATVWRGSVGQLELLAHEDQSTPLSSPIETLWTAHANRLGDVAFHARLADQRQAIFVIDSTGRFIPVIKSGDQIVGSQGNSTVQSFWTLGGTFGADPIVTGAGDDGIQGAFTADGRIAALVTYTTAGGAVIVASVPLLLFVDGFEGS